MPEQEKKLTLKEQIKTYYSGDLQKNALDFEAYLNESANRVCFIIPNPPELYVFVSGDILICNTERDDLPIDESLKEFTWANIHKCAHFVSNGEHCGCGQQPGSSYTILGKKFHNLCNCPIWFVDPDGETFERLKTLEEAYRLCVAELKK